MANTLVELTLLEMEDKYKGILTEPDADADFAILGSYSLCDKHIQNQIGNRIVESIKRFNEIIIRHLTDVIGQSCTSFLAELTLHFLENTEGTHLNYE